MVKNLIFDLDNTIIKDQESDAIYYKEALRKCGYDENDYLKIYDIIDTYDNSFTELNNYYNKNDMINFINKTLSKNYSTQLIEELLIVIGKYWTKNLYLEEETVKKLSEKYNLYVYTNYFEEAQRKRIETIGYLKYFKKVFGADNYGSKPFKKSFEKVLKELNSKPEECIMIGDSKDKDILAANNIGMKSILFDYNGKRDKKELKLENYVVVKNLNELLEIL